MNTKFNIILLSLKKTIFHIISFKKRYGGSDPQITSLFTPPDLHGCYDHDFYFILRLPMQ